MLWNLPTNERGRHLRAIFYLLAAFSLAAFGYLYFGLDHAQTMVYAVLAFTLFNATNHRSMFGSPVESARERGPSA